jgi:hypothetical protein
MREQVAEFLGVGVEAVLGVTTDGEQVRALVDYGIKGTKVVYIPFSALSMPVVNKPAASASAPKTRTVSTKGRKAG